MEFGKSELGGGEKATEDPDIETLKNDTIKVILSTLTHNWYWWNL